MTLFARFLKNESGATAIEYALIAAIVGVGILASLQPLTNAINATFDGIATTLTGPTAPAGDSPV